MKKTIQGIVTNSVLFQTIKNDRWFFLAITVLVLIFFRNAFSIHFFADDFAFLKASNISSLGQFLGFFNPFKETFYRPLSTEVFYFFIQSVPFPLAIGHGTVLFFYLCNLVLIYHLSMTVTKKQLFSRLLVFLYALHLSHVFQLYWFATFQEILVTFALLTSLHFFFRKRTAWFLLFFVIALLSKEHAIVYPVALLLFVLVHPDCSLKSHGRMIATTLPFSVLFGVLYTQGISGTQALPEYQVQTNPRLVVNNIIWYGLWSVGFPQNMPDFFPSLTQPPLPRFWEFFYDPAFRVYMYLLGLFLALITVIGTVEIIRQVRTPSDERERWLRVLAGTAVGFCVFLLPVLPIIHKWMVRLTIPVLFVSIVQAFLLFMVFTHTKPKSVLRSLAWTALGVYAVMHFYGVIVHESISTYLLESSITTRAYDVFDENRDDIQNSNVVYFADDEDVELSSWDGSEKLKTTFSDQAFLDYYFPGENIKAVYGFEEKRIPVDSLVIPASRFFSQEE